MQFKCDYFGGLRGYSQQQINMSRSPLNSNTKLTCQGLFSSICTLSATIEQLANCHQLASYKQTTHAANMEQLLTMIALLATHTTVHSKHMITQNKKTATSNKRAYKLFNTVGTFSSLRMYCNNVSISQHQLCICLLVSMGPCLWSNTTDKNTRDNILNIHDSYIIQWLSIVG